jgi:hypothetical protein
MAKGKNFIKQLEGMPKVDILAVGAIALNIYVVFTISGLSIQDLMEPMSGRAVTVIQASALVGAIYLIEYFGDEDSSSSQRLTGSSNDEKGLMSWIANMAEGSKVVDAASIGAVFLGYSYISENAGYGSSLTQFSTNPEVVAMQLSVLMMANFGIFLISDLMTKSSN